MDEPQQGNDINDAGRGATRRNALAILTAGMATLFGAGAGQEAAAKRHGKRRKKKRRPGPAPVPQATGGCDAATSRTTSTHGLNKFGQSFTASRAGRLRRVEIEIEKCCQPSAYTVFLATSTDGIPTNEFLAAASTSDESLPSGPVTLAAEFGNGPALTAGEEYAVVVTRPGSDGLVVLGDHTPACGPGLHFSPFANPPAPFVPEAGFHMAFSVFVT